jgi:hypothetical protein
MRHPRRGAERSGKHPLPARALTPTPFWPPSCLKEPP